MDIDKKKFIYIDSDKRINGDSSQFSYLLDLSDTEHYDYCTVLQASIPYTFYLIQDNFNTFQLKETSNDAVTVTIPKGNYNINSFSKIAQSRHPEGRF